MAGQMINYPGTKDIKKHSKHSFLLEKKNLGRTAPSLSMISAV